MNDANEREDVPRRAFVWDDSNSSTSESEEEDDATHYRVFRCQLCGQAIGEGSRSKKSNSRALALPCGHQLHKKCMKKHNVEVPGDCPVVRCKKSGKVDPATWVKLRGGTTEISRRANEDNESLRERLRDAERQVQTLIEQNESLMRNTPRTELELRERELKIAIDEAVRLRKELDELQATATALADRNRVLLLAHEGKEEPTPEELVEDAYAIEKEKRDFDVRFDAENRAIRDRRYQQFEEALRENDTSFERALSAISRARSFNHIEDHRVMMLLDLDRQAEEREITLTEILDGLDVVPVLGGVELPVAMQMIGLNSRLEELSISYEDIFELLNNETERARITVRRSQRQAEARPSTTEEPAIDEQPEAIKIEAVEQPIENEKPPTPSVVIPVLSPEVISKVNRGASLNYESVEDSSTPNSGKNSEVSPRADERVSRRVTRKRTSESTSAESSASKISRSSDIPDGVLIASLKLCLERASRDDLRGEIQRLLDMRGDAENDAKPNSDETENLIRKTLLEAKVKKQESTPKTEKRPVDVVTGTPASDADSSTRKSESRSSRKDTTTEGSSSKKSVRSSASKSGVSGVESIKRGRSRSSSSSSSDSSSSSSSPPKRPRRKAAAKKEAPAKKKSVSKKKKPTPPKKKPAAKKKAPARKRTTKGKPSTKEEPSVEKEITPERAAEGVQTRSKTRSESKSVEEGEITQSSQEVLELAASSNEVEELAASTPPPPPSDPAPCQPPPPPSPVLREQLPGVAQVNAQERARLVLIEREAQYRHNIEEMLRELDQQEVNAQAGYLEPLPVEECFIPVEQRPPHPAPVWILASFQVEPDGQRYYRNVWFPVTRDTLQLAMQSRGIILDDNLTARDDSFYERDGAAGLIGRYWREGVAFYGINSFIVIGDSLAHALVSEIIFQNREEKEAWKIHPMSGSRIPITTIRKNLRRFVLRSPQRVIMSIGQYETEKEELEEIKIRIRELWQTMFRHGTRHILMVPPVTWPQCPVRRNELRQFLRESPGDYFPGRYVYLEGLEEVVNRVPPTVFRGPTPYLNEHQVSEALVRVFEYASIERRHAYGHLARERDPPRPTDEQRRDQIDRSHELRRHDREARGHVDRNAVMERLAHEVHERDLIDRVQAQEYRNPNRRLLPEPNMNVREFEPAPRPRVAREDRRWQQAAQDRPAAQEQRVARDERIQAIAQQPIRQNVPEQQRQNPEQQPENRMPQPVAVPAIGVGLGRGRLAERRESRRRDAEMAQRQNNQNPENHRR
ncbi:uncharacterized protein LOC135833713 isoform X1 [Planococcus citri]|uniref:uncharacterized protein LOC135833713 isoform X1 n=1 Tax=Planococcus citri TaxID=170843 RepID=UPI0031F8954C